MQLKNVSILTIASLFTQLAQLISAPIITRLYSPEFYGSAMIYITIVSLFFPIINLRMEGPIVVSKNDDEIVNLIGICFLNTGIVLFISTIFYISIYNVTASTHEYLSYTFTLVMLAFYNTMYYSLLRYERYYYIGSALFSQQIIFILMLILFSEENVKNDTSFLLIFGVGYMIACFIMLRPFIKILRSGSAKNKKLLDLYKKYNNFVTFGALSSFVTALNWSGLAILIAFLFGDQILAFYTIAMRVLLIPQQLLVKNVSQVVFQKVSLGNLKNARRIHAEALNKLAILGAPLISLFVIYAEEIIVLLFGEDWIGATKIAVILAPNIFFYTWFSVSSTIYANYQKQKTEFFLNVTFVGLKSLTLLFGYLYYNSHMALTLYTMISCIGHFVVCFFAMRIIDMPERKYVLDVAKSLIFLIFLISCVFTIKAFADGVTEYGLVMMSLIAFPFFFYSSQRKIEW